MTPRNTEFELGGINHLALVCADMRRTVDFYSGLLGMPLIKTIELPGGSGQHFFFDCGGGDCVAFFWFADAPDGVPGISAPVSLPGQGEFLSAVGSMNHVAFHVPPERFDEYRARLVAKGVEVSPVMNHDDSPTTVAARLQEGVYVRSFYFQDPDGILLEFACWIKQPTGEPHNTTDEPRTAADRTPRTPVPASVPA
ncbi:MULTISPECIES: VOC family protein [unclassified Streptomyces]|uniref:VOC family protein n=1 Tax=unclassified Streptomyces TaxID=2593676 RepID=UPI00093A62A2|nr:VOC family protein [Streptomyces sp. TSRI0281]OKI32218.1 glyoxalase [Streptomyces sp. TSRI0281]